MADVFSSRKRSQIMSNVRSAGNQATEMAFIRFLRRHHIAGWRRGATIFGNPDLVFPAFRLAIFVDGCFWHGCPAHATQPASNRAFWKAKLTRNKQRDRLVGRTLRRSGWRVIRVWQHELSRKNQQRLLHRIKHSIEGSSNPRRERTGAPAAVWEGQRRNASTKRVPHPSAFQGCGI
jgi:DNA mismatch endonuclease (patch repair protein)